MEPSEIVKALEYCGTTFPRKAMEAAVADPQAVTPGLLEILEKAVARFEELIRDKRYFGVVPAMFLLAQFREKRAYSLIVDLFSRHSNAFEKWCPDFITEDLASALASVSGGDTEPMIELATTERVDEYVCDAAVRGILTLVVAGQKTRDEAIALYKTLFRHPKAPQFESMYWNGLVSCCTSLYPEEVMDEVRQAFEKGLVDPGFIRLEHVEKTLAEGKDATLANLRRYHYGLMDNVIEKLGSWASFQPDEEPRPARSSRLASAFGEREIARDSRKIGRNALCPCGSGKKYKKCCGRNQ